MSDPNNNYFGDDQIGSDGEFVDQPIDLDDAARDDDYQGDQSAYELDHVEHDQY